MPLITEDQAPRHDVSESEPIDLIPLLAPLARGWRLLAGAAFLGGALGAAGSYLITPTFTAATTFLPPQQQQSATASALSSLGSLAGFAGGSLKTPADQYVSLMRSVTVSDRIIERFKLMQLYEATYRRDARQRLTQNVQMEVGKKDGMITISVDDRDPALAAAIANRYIDELRQMTSDIAVSEAQQRRVFFERQMNDAKKKLTAAQLALQASGIDTGAMKTEPRAASDEYARLRAETTAADVKLQTLRNALTESAPEVQQQLATMRALRTKVSQLEQATTTGGASADYVSRYREFKYQETLFDLMAQQYEIARADESREGALIQVVDKAQPPEVKSKPKRSLIAVGGAIAAVLLLAGWLLLRRRPRNRVSGAV
jgi:uncharacterized protein involved in exopolysaccharide biosynthesis